MLRTYDFTTAQIEVAVKGVLEAQLYDPDNPEDIYDPRERDEFNSALQVATEAISILVEQVSKAAVLLTLVSDDDGHIAGYEFVYSFAQGARIVTGFFDFRDLVPDEAGLAGINELAVNVLTQVNHAIFQLNVAWTTASALPWKAPWQAE